VRSLRYFIHELGSLTAFASQVFRAFFSRPFEHRELLRQSYYLGVKTLPLVMVTGFILGVVLTLQSRPILIDFGAASLLPGMISVSIVREIGPVITALICAGKMASGIGAELGSMRVTEQIDAMEVSGIQPMKYLVLTRVLSTTFVVPLLVIFADAIALIGAYVAIQMRADVSLTLFFHQAFSALSFSDLIPATIKTFFLGYFIGLIGSYKGYYCDRGTEAVGKAANEAVVAALVSIFIINLVAVQLTDFFTNL
jgi:phospholipid/cholesterol/gamma-HCH transport system permease protein